MIQFFAPDILETGMLPETDSGHAVRVLRLREGDQVQVVDGKGNVYTCSITVAHPKRTSLAIEDCRSVSPAWDFPITVAVAPTKHIDRMEWLVEKLVEIGVNAIVPVRCARSERVALKTERLQKIAVSAMKQSLKAWLPEVAELTPLKDFLASCDAQQKFVGYCDADTPRKLLATNILPRKSTAILIGPEGDFTPEEIRATISAGFVPVTMGDNRLRTETAALVGCDTVHIINQLAEK